MTGQQGQQTRPFRFGVVAFAARSGDDWIAKARRVEELGYATLLMPDRLTTPLSVLPALAVAAAATRTLHVGPFVLASGLRNPVLLAKECASIGLLSGGRFEVGLGAGVGPDDFRMAGLDFGSPGERVGRLRETLAIVKALLHGQEVTTAGAHFRTEGARLVPPPAQPPPILVAGSGQRMLELAAREADVVGLGVSPADDETAVAEKVAWVRAAAGERFPQLELLISLAAMQGESVSPETAARLRERLSRFMRLDLEQLFASGSASVLAGTTDEMCETLLRRRERLGISYVTVPEDLMEALAPVVRRLAGR